MDDWNLMKSTKQVIISAVTRGSRTTSENENFLWEWKVVEEFSGANQGTLFMEVLGHPFGAASGMENESLWEVFTEFADCTGNRSRQQREIAAKKSKRSKKTQLRRGERQEWKIKFSFSENGEWRILLHLQRKNASPLRQTTNRASPDADFSENKSVLGSGVTTPFVTL